MICARAMTDTFRVTSHPERGRCAVAVQALRPGDLILAEPTLAFAINDALVRKRCAVTGCDTNDITCAECKDEEHYCDGVAEGGETRLARLVAAAQTTNEQFPQFH